MTTGIIIYLILGVVFTLLNIDYRAGPSWRGLPVVLATILVWPVLLLLRLLVTFKRILYPEA